MSAPVTSEKVSAPLVSVSEPPTGALMIGRLFEPSMRMRRSLESVRPGLPASVAVAVADTV